MRVGGGDWLLGLGCDVPASLIVANAVGRDGEGPVSRSSVMVNCPRGDG